MEGAVRGAVRGAGVGTTVDSSKGVRDGGSSVGDGCLTEKIGM